MLSASLCSHGLYAAGLTPSGAIRLHRHFIADLRRIARSPSHLTHESTSNLLQKLQFEFPLVQLQAQWNSSYERRQQKWTGLASDDFLREFDLHEHHAHVMQSFDQSMPHANLLDIQLCPHCTFSTQFRSQLTKHLMKEHAFIRPTYMYQPLRDSLEGCPQCAHCRKTFTRFPGLRKHICEASCSQFDPLQIILSSVSLPKTPNGKAFGMMLQCSLFLGVNVYFAIRKLIQFAVWLNIFIVSILQSGQVCKSD